MTEMASGFVQWYRNPKGGHGFASLPEQWVTDLERTDELQEWAKKIPA